MPRWPVIIGATNRGSITAEIVILLPIITAIIGLFGAITAAQVQQLKLVQASQQVARSLQLGLPQSNVEAVAGSLGLEYQSLASKEITGNATLICWAMRWAKPTGIMGSLLGPQKVCYLAVGL